VKLATKLKELTMSTVPEATERIAAETRPAMADAREAMQETSRQMQELMAQAKESGRPLHENPRIAEMLESAERAQELANAALNRAHKDDDRFSAFLEQANAVVGELKRNQECRAGIRERFTKAARRTLAAAPLPSS
jgi:PAS domain-containing protein